MEMKFRKLLTILLSTLFITAVSAESSFVGFTGIALDVQPESKALPQIFATGVVAGQYTLNDSLSFKGNFQFSTGDIVSNGLFRETPSTFSIREISGTYTWFKDGSIMYITALLGDQGSFGSNSFVQQYMGVRNFSSALLTPSITPASAGMNAFSGIGFSFTGDFGSDALGVYAFYDKNPKDSGTQINTDLRYAFLPGSSVIDTTFGITFPIETETPSGEKVFFLIRKIKFRTGISTLFTVSDRMKLFFQTGIAELVIPDLMAIGLNDLYLFVEPRISFSSCNMNISFFCLSDDTLKNLPFISKPLGCNMNVESLPFSLFNHTALTGLNFAVCAAKDPAVAASEGIDVVAAPYIDYSLLTGKFNCSFTFHPLDYADVAKFFKFSLSYKAQF